MESQISQFKNELTAMLNKVAAIQGSEVTEEQRQTLALQWEVAKALAETVLKAPATPAAPAISNGPHAA